MRANYSDDAIRALIESYPEISERRDTSPGGIYALVRIADVDRALSRLPLNYWEVVLLHGLLGLPLPETAKLLQVSHQAVSKRYRRALEDVAYYMNGGE